MTGWGGGWRVGSGWDRRGRSSRTFPERGSVVTTADAAMGGRGRTTGRDRLIVPAPGAGWILASVSGASMVKRRNGARGVGGGASLMGVSVSPAVLTLGGLAGGEGKFDLAFLREDDDPWSEGRNVVGVDGNNHGSGLLGLPESLLGLRYLAERIWVALSLRIACRIYGKGSSSSWGRKRRGRR